jgi:CspA family cold shock protein
MQNGRNPMSRTKQSDTIFYCDNCGISFLWSIEEQHQLAAQADDPAQSQPTRCAGCRALLPPADRERGLVKWYNRRKRFGFIVRHNQPDLFVHGSQIQGHSHLKPDELVEFSVAETDKGLAASAVRVLQTGG